MAVYTKITPDDLADISLPVHLENIRLEPIISGVENTNYHLFSGADRYILTLFEKRTDPKDLPFFIALMRHLAAHGLPCADVLTHEPFLLKGKSAIIASFLNGAPPAVIDPGFCFQAGTLLAAMHLAVDDFTPTRDNAMSVSQWRSLISTVTPQTEQLYPGMLDILRAEIADFEKIDTAGLPRGAIHADLFPDNVFFENGRLSGVIDFYFACTDFFIYDLMLAINAWCGSDFEKIAAFRKGYDSLRPLSPLEIKLLPAFGKAAALRIIATRLHDWFQHDPDASVVKKDPLEHFRLLEYYRSWDAARS